MPKRSDPFLDQVAPDADISPMIDVAFLLLIYFLVSTTLQKPEADLSLALPGLSAEDSRSVKLKELLIRVEPTGSVFINGKASDGASDDRSLPRLSDRLQRYAASAALAQSEPRIVIDCHDEGKGQRFIDVLNACAKAKIHNISLSN